MKGLYFCKRIVYIHLIYLSGNQLDKKIKINLLILLKIMKTNTSKNQICKFYKIKFNENAKRLSNYINFK